MKEITKKMIKRGGLFLVLGVTLAACYAIGYAIGWFVGKFVMKHWD